MEDRAPQEPHTEPEIRRRHHKADPALALEKLAKRLESPDLEQRPEKITDSLMRAADIRLQLLNLDTQQRNDTSQQTIKDLQARALVDVARISELEVRAIGLATRPVPTVVQDPDSLRLRNQNATLKTFLTFVLSELPDAHARAVVCIRALLKHGTVAQVMVEAVPDFDFSYFWQGMNRTVDDLREGLSRCQDPDGPHAIFARAMLEAKYDIKVPKSTKRYGVVTLPAQNVSLAE